jgi:hypothetical protein
MKNAMRKPPVSDDECTAHLLAAAEVLTRKGASVFDIVTNFIDVALTLAQRDRDYGIPQLEIVANAFTAGEDAARLTIEKLTPPKRPRKHK